jgi:uncharacterized protein GlcG (DUF336 family)
MGHRQGHHRRSFRFPTHMLKQGLESDPALMASALNLAPAGYPLLAGQSVVGEIGIGGGTPEQDQVVAEAGAAALHMP